MPASFELFSVFLCFFAVTYRSSEWFVDWQIQWLGVSSLGAKSFKLIEKWRARKTGGFVNPQKPTICARSVGASDHHASESDCSHTQVNAPVHDEVNDSSLFYTLLSSPHMWSRNKINDVKTFLKHFSDRLFYFCSTCADAWSRNKINGC